MSDPALPPDRLEGTTAALVDFALTSLVSPSLLVDGGGMIEAASPAALADMGLSPDEIQGAKIDDLLGIGRIELASLARGRASIGSTTITLPGGEQRSAHLRAAPLASGRHDGGWLVEFWLADPDDQASPADRSEQLDEMVDDLSDRYERLDRFVSIISHDLQAPARRLLAFVQLSRRDHPEASTTATPPTTGAGRAPGTRSIGENLDAIERSARYMLRLTTELLDFSRLGREPMPLVAVDAGDVLELTLEQLDLELLDAGATVTVHRPLPDVLASPTFLSLVFQELIQNAIAYRRSELLRVEIRAVPAEAADEICFEISDNGIGIADDEAETIFEPFRRLVTSDLQHTGLGLATTSEVVGRFGGSIEVARTTLGEGTTFALTLKAAHG